MLILQGFTMQCQLCDFNSEKLPQPGRKLSNHLRKEHQMTVDDYVINTLRAGEEPTCPICGVRPRRVGFKFKKFCKDHSHQAAVEGGRRGGKAPAWNKGLTKESDPRLAQQAQKMSGEGNPFYGKRHTEASLRKMRNHRRISQEEFESRCAVLQGRGVRILDDYERYESRQHQYLRVTCTTCGTRDHKTLQTLERGSLCITCHPRTTSQAEREIANFVLQHVSADEVVRNDRHLIGPKEIDILVPNQGLGIEYEGLYWHSEASPDPPSSRDPLQKTADCWEQNIRLLRIYEDQWRDRRHVCESVILHGLGVMRQVGTRHHARQCEVIAEMPKAKAQEMMQSWHMYGSTPCRSAFGLRHHGEWVSVITARIPRQRKYREKNLVEIARFASKPMSYVSGGLSRLLSYMEEWARKEGFTGVITYADLDHGDGGGYQRAGFKHVGDTGPSYWYTDGVSRFNRFKYRASSDRSEREVASEAGVYRIYGAGSRIYLKIF